VGSWVVSYVECDTDLAKDDCENESLGEDILCELNDKVSWLAIDVGIMMYFVMKVELVAYPANDESK